MSVSVGYRDVLFCLAITTISAEPTHAFTVYKFVFVPPFPHFKGFMGVYMLVCHVFPNLPVCTHMHVCLFFAVFALASPMLSSYSLAAAGQLINQIFKQRFSAQWVVLDYLWLLAVHSAATL